MGYYPDLPPRHSHRSPTEIAEDEMLATLRGEFCGVLAQPGSQSQEAKKPEVIPRNRALVAWVPPAIVGIADRSREFVAALDH